MRCFPGNCLHFSSHAAHSEGTCLHDSPCQRTHTLSRAHTRTHSAALLASTFCLVSKVPAPSGLSAWSWICIRTWRGSIQTQGCKHAHTQQRPEGSNLRLALKEQLIEATITKRQFLAVQRNRGMEGKGERWECGLNLVCGKNK